MPLMRVIIVGLLWIGQSWNHVENDCEEAPIVQSCHFKQHGCTVDEMKRNDLDQHGIEILIRHAQLVSEKNG